MLEGQVKPCKNIEKRLDFFRIRTAIGSASVEFALFFFVIAPLFLVMVSVFNWLLFLKEVSLFEHSWANVIPLRSEHVVESGWDGVGIRSTNWAEILASCEQQFRSLFDQSFVPNSVGAFLRLDLWNLSFDAETGDLQSVASLGSREISLNKSRTTSDYDKYRQNIQSMIFQSIFGDPVAVPIEGLVVHYDFGPTSFGNAREINFFPFKVLATYYIEVEARSELLQQSLNLIGTIIGARPFVYSASRILPAG